MIPHTYLEHGVSILHARLQTSAHVAPTGPHTRINPFVTLSRETGAGATTIGLELVPLLNRDLGDEHHPWVFLDKELLNSALQHHQLPARLAAFLPEDRVSEIRSAIDELVGLHPSLWELEHKVAEAILQLAHVGRVVLAGRAGHVITHALPGGLHVRLIASPDTRARRMAQQLHCSQESAREHIDKTDAARRRFLRTRFAREADDPHLYDLVINTDHFGPAAAAQLIVQGLHERLASHGAGPAAFGQLPRLSPEQLRPVGRE